MLLVEVLMQTGFILEKIHNEVIDPNTNKWNDFVNTCKKVYPDLKEEVKLEKAQKLWNNVKNDLTKFGKTLADLQKKMHRRESKQLTF